MGITIDEIIQELERTKDYPASDPASDEALDGAIDIMRKYQQIQRIYSDILENKDGTHFLEDVSEVLDGNDD